jgi:hypothetical protein
MSVLGRPLYWISSELLEFERGFATMLHTVSFLGRAGCR